MFQCEESGCRILECHGLAAFNMDRLLRGGAFGGADTFAFKIGEGFIRILFFHQQHLFGDIVRVAELDLIATRFGVGKVSNQYIGTARCDNRNACLNRGRHQR